MIARLTMTAVAGMTILSGCSQAGKSDQPQTFVTVSGHGTLASAVAESRDLHRLSSALNETQLAPVLDGKGEYTLLAPTDAAFEALGDKDKVLADKDQQPLLIAILRGHLLPGAITPSAIVAAIARKGGPVEMNTMAGGTVRFSKDAKGLTVTKDGATVRIAGTTQTAANGTILPIDAVLLPAGNSLDQ